MSVYKNTFLSVDIEVTVPIPNAVRKEVNTNTKTISMCEKLGLAEVTEEEINEEFISFVIWGSRHYRLDLNKVEI